YQPNGNVVANLLALAVPVSVVLAADGALRWRLAGWGQRLRTVAAALSTLVILVGLGFSQSRASAIALAGAAGLGLWWWLASRWSSRAGRDPLAVFGAGVALVVLVGLGAALALPQLLTVALGTLPGPNSVISRTQLFGQVWHLAQDTPFTGGGL